MRKTTEHPKERLTMAALRDGAAGMARTPDDGK
jgi:hypothetical protein